MTETVSSLPFRPDTRGPGAIALSGLLGVVFTLSLFLGIAHLEKTGPVSAPPEIDDLRAVSIPIEPPPRLLPQETTPVETTVTGFESAAADSPVKIAVSPPDLDSLLPPPAVAPPAVIQIGQLYTNLKPRMDLSGIEQRIYQQSEVDQKPVVLYRVMPEITTRMFNKQDTMTVVLLLVIDTNGAVTSIKLAQSSGNREVDAIMQQNIREWAFSSAVRKGRKVKCLLQQRYDIKLPSASHFRADI